MPIGLRVNEAYPFPCVSCGPYLVPMNVAAIERYTGGLYGGKVHRYVVSGSLGRRRR